MVCHFLLMQRPERDWNKQIAIIGRRGEGKWPDIVYRWYSQPFIWDSNNGKHNLPSKPCLKQTSHKNWFKTWQVMLVKMGAMRKGHSLHLMSTYLHTTLAAIRDWMPWVRRPSKRARDWRQAWEVSTEKEVLEHSLYAISTNNIAWNIILNL